MVEYFIKFLMYSGNISEHLVVYRPVGRTKLRGLNVSTRLSVDLCIACARANQLTAGQDGKVALKCKGKWW